MHNVKPNSAPSKGAQVIVCWILWLAILSGLMMLTFLMGKGIPFGGNPNGEPISPLVFISFAMAVITIGIRWFLIPRVVGTEKLLPVMIVGLALSDVPGLLSIVLIPEEMQATRMLMWWPAFLSILQFIPVYAGRSSRLATR